MSKALQPSQVQSVCQKVITDPEVEGVEGNTVPGFLKMLPNGSRYSENSRGLGTVHNKRYTEVFVLSKMPINIGGDGE